MPSDAPASRLSVTSGGVTLAGEQAGGGPPLLLLHGLTATRRYVTLGSRLLERSGLRVISYDARSHGASGTPADPSRHDYADLAADAVAVLDAAGADRAAIAAHSMGAATAIRVALDDPGRVAALVIAGPAYRGDPYQDEADLARWDALADGLERNGVDGFMAAYDPLAGGEWGERVRAFTRQRLERHEDPRALAAAVRVVPRSVAFEGLERLTEVAVPCLVVGSRDEPDPGHPLAVAEEYARLLPDARLAVEDPGETPLAWRGAALSRTIRDFLETVGYS